MRVVRLVHISKGPSPCMCGWTVCVTGAGGALQLRGSLLFHACKLLMSLLLCPLSRHCDIKPVSHKLCLTHTLPSA